MIDSEPPIKPRHHPRDANLERLLAEIKATRQTYLGITEQMRAAYQDAVQDDHDYQAGLDNQAH